MQTQEEIWKDVVGYEGLYQVSNIGRVRSLGHDKWHKGRILKPIIDGKGAYFYVGLFKNGKRKGESIHRIVATAFIPNPKNLPCVNHKDENKQNNKAENLEWCDYSYNATYGEARFKNVIQRTKNNSRNRELPVLMKDENGNIIARFRSCFEASRVMGVSRVTIRRCCINRRNGKNHHAGGYCFEYDSNLNL